MSKLLQELKNLLSKFLRKDNRKTVTIGAIVGVFIASSPYLFYLYESVPNTQTWNTFLFTYNSRFYENANTAMWILTGKLIPLIYLIIWFFTNKHWWYHALIVPIAMYIYQIINFFNDETNFLDEFQLLYMVPLMALVIPSIYLIRAQMFNKLNDADKSFEELEREFMIRPKTFWGKVKQYF